MSTNAHVSSHPPQELPDLSPSPLSNQSTEATTPKKPSRAALRRLGLGVAAAALLGLATYLLALPVAQAQTSANRELRIGYQKAASIFVLQKTQGTLEKRLAPLSKH